MDWLDEQIVKIKSQNLGLKQTLRLYTLLGVVLVLLAQYVTTNICLSWERLMLANQSVATMDASDFLYYELVLIIRTYSFIPYMIIAIFTITHFFYREKMARPIIILQEQIKQVTAGQLDIPYYYQSGDEFEDVCRGFDEMRGQLRANQAEILALHQQQKQLNAIFSHDLRTPLTVMQGNIQMIQHFQPTGQLEPQQLEKSLSKIERNISRLINYADTMQELQSFDEIEVDKSSYTFSAIKKEAKELGVVVSKEVIYESNGESKGSLVLDLAIFNQVLGNLLSNAERFARQTIKLSLELTEDYLFLFVQDDGPGFQGNDLYQAAQPYFSNDKNRHFGLGLTICQLLTQKHGGDLHLDNSLTGGAIISASFNIHAENR